MYIRFPEAKFYAEYLEKIYIFKTNHYTKSKKDLKLPYVLHLICLLISIYTLNTKFQKKLDTWEAAGGAKLW